MALSPYIVDGLWAAGTVVVAFLILTSSVTGKVVMALSHSLASRRKRETMVLAAVPDLKRLVVDLNSPILDLAVEDERVEFRYNFGRNHDIAAVRVWSIRWLGNMSPARAGYEVTSISYCGDQEVQKQRELYDGPKWATRAVINQFASVVFDEHIVASIVTNERLRDLFDSPELLQRYQELQNRASCNLQKSLKHRS